MTEAFALLIQLPPLAFGPARPPEAFAPPRALVCPLRELGRIQAPGPPSPPTLPNPSLDPRSLALAPDRFLINRPADLLLFLAVAYAGRASWDDRSWAARMWEKSGGVTPVLIPPAWGPKP